MEWIPIPKGLDSGLRFFTILEFKFQIAFLRFNFQRVWDSGFKFGTGDILDSDFSLQGPISVLTPFKPGSTFRLSLEVTEFWITVLSVASEVTLGGGVSVERLLISVLLVASETTLVGDGVPSCT